MVRSLAVILAASLALAAAPVLAGDVDAGQARSATCAGCHGPTGISPSPMYPNLAGQNEAYLVKATRAYMAGERSDATMKAMVAALSDDDIHNLAAFYAAQNCN